MRTGMGISVGSETAGGIRDVRVHDNLVLGMAAGPSRST